MSRYLTGNSSKCEEMKNAINVDSGCPAKGETTKYQDLRIHPSIPGPGWTTDICEPILVVNPGTAALEIPDEHLHRLGKQIGQVQLPPQSSALDIVALPPPLRSLARARKGLDADGNPLPRPNNSEPKPEFSSELQRETDSLQLSSGTPLVPPSKPR